MTGLRMSAMNVGPLSCDKNLLVAFAPGHVEIPTTSAVFEHPKHGVVLWDTGINEAVADPDRADAYWGANVRAAFGPHAFTREHVVDAQVKKLGINPKDVRYVIYSHLHLDHAGGMSYFPDAVHVVQHDESAMPCGPILGLGRSIARMISGISVSSTSSKSMATSISSMTGRCDSLRRRAMRLDTKSSSLTSQTGAAFALPRIPATSATVSKTWFQCHGTGARARCP